jgi:anti-anti-sigma factor
VLVNRLLVYRVQGGRRVTDDTLNNPRPNSVLSAITIRAIPPLEVTVREAAGEIVVRLKGAAGVDEGWILESALLPLWSRRSPHVIFDLGELQFISSLAMGMLVAFRRWVVGAGGQVRLAAIQPTVRDALTRARLSELFADNAIPAGAPVRREAGTAPGPCSQ